MFQPNYGMQMLNAAPPRQQSQQIPMQPFQPSYQQYLTGGYQMPKPPKRPRIQPQMLMYGNAGVEPQPMGGQMPPTMQGGRPMPQYPGSLPPGWKRISRSTPKPYTLRY